MWTNQRQSLAPLLIPLVLTTFYDMKIIFLNSTLRSETLIFSFQEEPEKWMIFLCGYSIIPKLSLIQSIGVELGLLQRQTSRVMNF